MIRSFRLRITLWYLAFFALLFAIVADVDAGLALFRHHPAKRVTPRFVDLCRVDCRAARALGIETRQRDGTRQAAGVRGQDAVAAKFHGVLPVAGGFIFSLSPKASPAVVPLQYMSPCI